MTRIWMSCLSDFLVVAFLQFDMATRVIVGVTLGVTLC